LGDVEAKRNFPLGHDKTATKYIDDFLTKIGGKESVTSVSDYAIAGSATTSLFGARNVFSFRAFETKPDKYSEVYNSASIGEIRETFDGKKHFIQADFGIDQDLQSNADVKMLDILSPIFDIASDENYPSLSFTGTFDRDGRKTAVIEGRTKLGSQVALAFDVETGLLVNMTVGPVSISYSDYKKVGNVMLPFKIDRSGVMKVEVHSITVNQPIDPAAFLKRERCFDKAN
jgi:hypothetical protein